MVKFLQRPGCPLCEKARPLVESEAKSRSLQVEIVDIEEDDALIAEFGIRIPVVLGPGDMVLAEGEIEPKSLRRALRRL